MSDFDIDILKKNVRDLLKENNMNQEALGKEIGMSQPNICKALSAKDKKCFTVAQIFAIAEYFHVSIDWLVGHSADMNKLSQRSIAELLSQLLLAETAKPEVVTVVERVYKPYWDPDGYPDCTRDKQSNSYKAIYFPNYYDPGQIAKDEDEYQELDSIACQEGNETRNVALNTFLIKFLQILDIYKAGNLSEEAFQIVLKEYLGQLSDK
ncbi:MAG: helix-turn-helix domain-containing protein [Eubacteriales bacterium]|nr:helix-turn-helix domain-containing protein [Eubacteriales bacterium]